MAGTRTNIYDKQGQELGGLDTTGMTIGNVLTFNLCINNGISELSDTLGGQPLAHSASASFLALYDASPDPVTTETITGFYLDGTEYKFKGGGAAEGISTEQPSNPVTGSTYYDTTNKVIKVYNGTTWEEVGGGNVIAMTQSEYDALPAATKNDGKLRIITDAPTLDIVDDTAFGASWDGDTDTAPSKNAVYDAIGNIETLLAAI